MFTLTSQGVGSLSMNRVYSTVHVSRVLDIFLIYNYNLFHFTNKQCIYIAQFCSMHSPKWPVEAETDVSTTYILFVNTCCKL